MPIPLTGTGRQVTSGSVAIETSQQQLKRNRIPFWVKYAAGRSRVARRKGLGKETELETGGAICVRWQIITSMGRRTSCRRSLAGNEFESSDGIQDPSPQWRNHRVCSRVGRFASRGWISMEILKVGYGQCGKRWILLTKKLLGERPWLGTELTKG